MKKYLALPLLFVCQIILAQVPVVNNLHYKYTEAFKSPKKEDAKHNWFNFHLDSNQLVITTEKPNKSFEMGMLDKTEKPFTEVIDRNNAAIIVIFGNMTNYILEQLPLFPVVDKLMPDEYEEEQVINGYKCRCYKGPQAAAPAGAGATGMGAQIYNTLAAATQNKIWVTTEIALNDNFNPYILGVLRGVPSNPKFNGVIVKMEKKLGFQDKTYTYTYELDTSKLYEKHEKPVMPWNEPEPRTALIEAPLIKGNGSNIATCTRETCPQRNQRMKEFLEKTAGKEKAKSTFMSSTFLPCNFWRTF